MVEKIALRATSFTKDGSSRSGLDADSCRRMLTSNSFYTTSSDMHKSIADFTKTFAVR